MITTQEEIVFAGFGGQGVMFAGQLLAYAAMDAGYHVTWIPSYGPEMRGGTANCFVVISPNEIGSPAVRNPRAGLVFNIPSFDKFEPLVAPAGTLVVNSALVTQSSHRDDIHTVYIPATEIASDLGHLQLTNMVMMGALLTIRPLLPLEAIQAALAAHIPARRRDMLPMNFGALEQGAAYVTAHYMALMNV